MDTKMNLTPNQRPQEKQPPRPRGTLRKRRPPLVALAGAALACLLSAALAEAGDRSYKLCDIVNGQIFSCGSWYQGKAVVNKDNAFRECDIVNGQVFSCGSWYQGKAVVYTNR